MQFKSKIPGFTITELLVTLVLTSIALTFAYSTLSYIQKLFNDYRQQNNFLTEAVRLKSFLEHESLKCFAMTKLEEKKVLVRSEIGSHEIVFNEKNILVKNEIQVDTFHFAPKEIKFGYERTGNQYFDDKLINKLEFDVFFSKRIFKFSFYKKYASDIKIYYSELNK